MNEEQLTQSNYFDEPPNDRLNLANNIHLAIMAFFQERAGFDHWWDSLDGNIKAAIEQNLIDKIYDVIKGSD